MSGIFKLITERNFEVATDVTERNFEVVSKRNFQPCH